MIQAGYFRRVIDYVARMVVKCNNNRQWSIDGAILSTTDGYFTSLLGSVFGNDKFVYVAAMDYKVEGCIG